MTSEELLKLFSQGSSPLNPVQAELLLAYLARLTLWSARINLTGHRSEKDAAERLLYDAVELAPLIPRDSRVLDIGAGAGGLAVTLVVLRSDLNLVAVEPRQKRAAFLRKVRRELNLTRLKIAQERAEALLSGPHVPADAAYAQAVMAPRQWLPLGARLVREGGAVLCLTSSQLDPTVIPRTLESVDHREYELPISRVPRTVTLLRTAKASTIQDP